VPPNHRQASVGAHFIHSSRFHSTADDQRYAMQNAYDLLLVVTGGRMWSDTAGEVVEGTVGHVVYHRADTAYTEWTDPADPAEGYKILFSWSERPSGLPAIVVDSHGHMRRGVRRLMEVFEIPDYSHRQAATLMFFGLLGEYYELSLDGAPAIIRELRDYTMNRLDAPFVLAEVAAHFGYHPSYFVRKYTAIAGHGPMHAVRLCRLEAARSLALSTDLPVKAIAARTGFADASHLSRLFRRTFHLTITDLRATS